MPKKEKLIEPIPATMKEVVKVVFAKHPKPRDPEKEKEKGKIHSYNLKVKQETPDKELQTFFKLG